MSLPLGWVERIFARLTLIYGRDFMARWDGQDVNDVIASWADELGVFSQNPEAIKYGLENLPAAKPPTVLEFRAICNRRPDPPAPRLPPPTVSPEVITEALAAINAARPEVAANKAPSMFDHLRDLRDKGLISAGQRDFLERAESGMPQRQVGDIGDFTPIARDVWPEAMKAVK